jgi:hypothetical protein
MGLKAGPTPGKVEFANQTNPEEAHAIVRHP